MGWADGEALFAVYNYYMLSFPGVSAMGRRAEGQRRSPKGDLMNQRRGFTLVEVAVAIAVVAILAAIIIPMLLKNLRDARRARARNDLQVIAGAGAELQYRGPYMTLAMANSSDPWGHSYVILGYNRFGMDGHRPIWVVCAGEAGTIAGENLRGGPGVPGLLGAPPAAWSYAGASATNIVIEIK
jgi:prepilin-type N-terminal cleavage/methylation domain-containing protein